jgi:hypothetical protein
MNLVELLLSMGLTVTLSAAAMALVGAAQTIARTQPEASDLQQHARVALRVLKAELAGAGAGVDRGTLAGTLTQYFAPVHTSADGGLTVWTVSNRDAQGTLRSAVPAGATMVALDDNDGCPAGQGACGFVSGTTAILFDAHGCFEAARIDAVSSDLLTLRSGLACSYTSGAAVAEARVFTYIVDRVARQLLRRDEALGTTVPVLDAVASMDIEYVADPWRARLTLRLVAANPLLRIPDLVVSLDVAPANLQSL